MIDEAGTIDPHRVAADRLVSAPPLLQGINITRRLSPPGFPQLKLLGLSFPPHL